MARFQVVQIEISKTYGQEEWHEDLRKLLKKAGEASKKVHASKRDRRARCVFCFCARPVD